MNTIRGKPATALFVVSFAMFVDVLVYGLMIPVLPGYASDFGASQGTLGLLVGTFGIAVVAATPLFGMLSDRYGSKWPMVGGLMGLAASTLLFAYAPGLGWLFVGRAFQGVSSAASWVAGLALLARVYPAAERGRAMGTAVAGTTLATLLGPPFGGFLYDLGGPRLPFLVAAGIAAGDGLARLLLISDDKREDGAGESFALRALLSDRLVVLGGLAVLLTASAKALIEPVLPLHLSEELGASASAVGLLFGAATLAYGIFAPVIGALSDRLGRPLLFSLGLVALGISLPLLVAPGNLWVEALAMAAFGIAVGCALAPTTPFLAEAAERMGLTNYGLVYAFFNLAFAAGLTLGPVLAALLADDLSLSDGLLIAGGVVCACGVSMLFVMRKVETR
jgi:DHA1 family solute carrier family 18 vesicular amine transporter 1/2